jgi:hypothetical protein
MVDEEEEEWKWKESEIRLIIKRKKRETWDITEEFLYRSRVEPSVERKKEIYWIG